MIWPFLSPDWHIALNRGITLNRSSLNRQTIVGPFSLQGSSFGIKLSQWDYYCLLQKGISFATLQINLIPCHVNKKTCLSVSFYKESIIRIGERAIFTDRQAIRHRKTSQWMCIIKLLPYSCRHNEQSLCIPRLSMERTHRNGLL